MDIVIHNEANLFHWYIFQKFLESCGFNRWEWFNEIDAINKAGILFPKFKSNTLVYPILSKSLNISCLLL